MGNTNPQPTNNTWVLSSNTNTWEPTLTNQHTQHTNKPTCQPTEHLKDQEKHPETADLRLLETIHQLEHALQTAAKCAGCKPTVSRLGSHGVQRQKRRAAKVTAQQNKEEMP